MTHRPRIPQLLWETNRPHLCYAHHSQHQCGRRGRPRVIGLLDCDLVSLALYESNGDAWGIGAALNNLGECAELLGDMPAAQRYHRASLAYSLGIGDQPGVAFARANLGGLLRLEGRLDEAESELRAGLEVANALGFDYARGLLTQGLAACAWARRDGPTARRLAEDAQRIFVRSQSADRAELPARLLAEIGAAAPPPV